MHPTGRSSVYNSSGKSVMHLRLPTKNRARTPRVIWRTNTKDKTEQHDYAILFAIAKWSEDSW